VRKNFQLFKDFDDAGLHFFHFEGRGGPGLVDDFKFEVLMLNGFILTMSQMHNFNKGIALDESSSSGAFQLFELEDL
jgi:hypothetical protein